MRPDYVYGDSIDEVLTISQGGNTYFYHYDGLGSVTEITNPSGNLVESYTYDVYGTPKIYNSSGVVIPTSAIGNRYMFTGREYDAETGNYHYRARSYHPGLGRFMQIDPIGYYDSMNLMQYVGNNPTNWGDPLGLYFESGSDFMSWQLSLHEYSTNPNFISGASLAYDSAALLLPIPGFAGYAQKVGKLANSAGKAAVKICKPTTVIGHLDDTMVAKNWPGHDVLDDPLWGTMSKDDFWEQVNKPWLDKAIANGNNIYIAGKLKNPNSLFAKELEYLKSKGYHQVGDYMVKD